MQDERRRLAAAVENLEADVRDIPAEMRKIETEIAEAAAAIRIRRITAHRLEQEAPRQARAALRLKFHALAIRCRLLPLVDSKSSVWLFKAELFTIR